MTLEAFQSTTGDHEVIVTKFPPVSTYKNSESGSESFMLFTILSLKLCLNLLFSN